MADTAANPAAPLQAQRSHREAVEEAFRGM